MAIARKPAHTIRVVSTVERTARLKCAAQRVSRLCLLLFFSAPFSSVLALHAQTPPKPQATKPDYSKEAFVVEQDSTTVTFQNDGTSTREVTGRIRIQSEAGLQRYGVLSIAYQSASEAVDVEYVRAKKPDGSAVSTPMDEIQDMPADITRAAPFYSDLREKHIAVKGLSIGDTLEFAARFNSVKPLAPGQFWLAFNFSRDVIVLQQTLRIGVPRSRPVKWKSSPIKPVITDEGERRVFTWTSSQLEKKSSDEEKKEQELRVYQSARGQLPPPDVLLSSFQSWAEVARWYETLQRERVQPTPEIRAKANQLIKNVVTDDAKLRTVYKYVSTDFRYIGVAFGIGRYQPHAAADVLDNQYGDCKDKHTLLASLLDAAGVKAYAALINSTRQIDIDVPSPGQFDHVITAVPQGKEWLWLDTTPEVAPFGYLLARLRQKQALVIGDDMPPALMTTPADESIPASQTFTITAKLDDSGTLEGDVERAIRGTDLEILLRTAFRQVEFPKWKDLIQQISYGSGFAGDVSQTTASAPEKTDEPFRISYHYTRKKYPDWEQRRISSPLPPLALPALPDDGSKPSHPVWLGPPGEAHFISHVELPKGYTPELPKKVDINDAFAEYHASYSIKNGVLTTDRRLIVKLPEVPDSEYDVYRKLRSAAEDDHDLYVTLSTGSSSVARSYQDDIWKLPDSTNPEAARAYDEARTDYDAGNTKAEIEALNRAVESDPRFTRAWLWLGEIYSYSHQFDSALQAYRKAVEIDPAQPVGYKVLALALVRMGRFEESVPVWQQLIKLAPEDSIGPAGLAGALLALKHYAEAAEALQSALTLDPQRADLRVQLGSAYLRAGDEDKALSAYQEALKLDSHPVMFNDVGYELADAGKHLPMALEYASKAVREEEQASQKVKLSDLQLDDVQRTSRLAAFWDTLGWAYFRQGNLEIAQRYLYAAWTLSQSPVIADHLGQVYEKENKKHAAVDAYYLALAAFSFYPGKSPLVEQIRKKIERLGVQLGNPTSDSYSAGDELSRMRTIKLPRLTSRTATAEVFLVIGPGGKVEDVSFINGSEKFKSGVSTLTSVHVSQTFPDDGPTRLVRRAFLGCYSITGCSLVLVPPDLVRSLK